MTTTSEKILQSIKEKHLCPAPRWKFSIRNSAFWAMFGAALLVGALSFSVVMELLVNHDWDIYGYLHKTFFGYLMLSLPYLWIICAVVFSALAYYYFVHTKNWYCHCTYRIILASIFLCVALGIAFFFLGFGRQIDKALAGRIPFYDIMNADKKKIWTHPDEGLLGGEVVRVSSGSKFVIQDYNGNEWDVENLVSNTNNLAVAVGENVKIIGTEKNQQTFEAKEIRQWEPRTSRKNSDGMVQYVGKDGQSEE